MGRKRLPPLSRRERQIMDILFARSEATAAEVQAGLPDPPSYSAVRALLRILEEKGHITHKVEAGNRYVFVPTVPQGEAAKSALKGLLKTFFAGSIEKALATHLADPHAQLSDDELKRLTALIEEAKKRDRT